MPSNYSDYTNTILRNTAFANSSFLARSSRAAYCLLLLGTIISIISLVMSVWLCSPNFGLGSLVLVPISVPLRSDRRRARVFFVPDPVQFDRGHAGVRFVSGSTAPALATILVFAGSAIWTAIINQAKDVNSWTVQPARHPLGIKVSAGPGLYCAWVAFGFLGASAIGPTIECVLFFCLILTLTRFCFVDVVW